MGEGACGVRNDLANGKARAVFLDRDGVLTETLVSEGRAYAPVTLEEFRIAEGAPAQVARLRDAGLRRIVVTNQPELARGALDPRALDRMHEILRASMDLDDLFLCGHDPGEGCACHKPGPGLLHAAAARWNLDLRESFLVGDRWRDIGAGAAAGCYTILIERPYSRCDTADARVRSLADAVDLILARLGSPARAGR